MSEKPINLVNLLDRPQPRVYTFKNVGLALLCIFIMFVYQYLMIIRKNTYIGIIKLQPQSERSKPYLSFVPESKSLKKSYMILVKDLEFNAKIESFTNKRVKVRANIHLHEPKDFNKINIFDIKLAN